MRIRKPPDKAEFKRNMKACKRADDSLFFTKAIKKPIQYWSQTRLPPADASAITPVFQLIETNDNFNADYRYK